MKRMKQILAVGLVLIATLAVFAATASAAVVAHVGPSHEQLTSIGYLDLGVKYLVATYDIKQPLGYGYNEWITFFVDVNQDGVFSDLELVPFAGPGATTCNKLITPPTGATPLAPISYACYNIIPAAFPPLMPGSNYKVLGILNGGGGIGPIVDPLIPPVYGNTLVKNIRI